jgi:hypothetical protein
MCQINLTVLYYLTVLTWQVLANDKIALVPFCETLYSLWIYF